MPVPPRRQPIQVARGTYCSLNTNRDVLLDGEICYAEDLRALFIAEERNQQMELMAVRTTVRPEPPPPLRLLGLLDPTTAGTAPVPPAHGDVVLANAAGPAAADWAGLAGSAIAVGDQLVFDKDLGVGGGWQNLGPLAALPAWLVDLSTLPALP